MSKAELLDGHVSAKQCKKAMEALLTHAVAVQEKKEEKELLPGKEQHIWLVVAVKKMQPEKKLKPFKIPIKHPLVDPRTSPVCLITKDPQREYKDLLESHGIKFISRVVGITKLKGKFKPFEARRMLLQENGLFLADERVVPLLPGLLGKGFFQAKKQPIPVCLTRKDLKGELERAISSTYMHQNLGTCTSIKIGTLSQKLSQVLDNLRAALPAVIKHIKGEWDNIQSLHIKTSSSVSLPIWTCELGAEQGGRWDGLLAGEEGVGGEMDVDGAEVEVEAPPTPKDKGKKRAAEPQAVEEQQPKKKVKASDAPPTAKPSPDAKVAPPKKAKKTKAPSQSEPPKAIQGTPAASTTPPEPAQKKRKDKSKAKAPEPTTPSSDPHPAQPPAPAVAVQPTPVAPREKRAKRKSKQGLSDARIATAATASSILDIPASDNSMAIVPTSGAEADVESATESSTKRRKKRKNKTGVTAPSETPETAKPEAVRAAVQEAPAVADNSVGAVATKAKKTKKRKARSAEKDNTETAAAPPAITYSNSESAIPAQTTTTPIAEKKKARALAADFFDPATPTPSTSLPVPAVPVNTPATPGDLDTPAKKKRRKKNANVLAGNAGVDAPRLAEALSEDARTSDPRAGVVPANISAAPESEGLDVDPTTPSNKPKKRRKGKKEGNDLLGTSNGTDAVASGGKAAAMVGQEEVKQKRKERKKDKVTKGKPGKSIKEDIIGKKASLA